MSKFDRTCIVADLENKLAAVDSTTNTFEAYALSASVKALTNDRQVTVACACDLPDLLTCTDIPDGQPIYVEEYQVPVINSNCCWIGIDGRIARSDLPDTTLWGWGSNASGQLGTNNTTNYSTPTQEHCGGTTWCKVSAGGYHTSAIKTDGTLWSWGSNSEDIGEGMLGTNNTTSYSTPTQEHCGGTTWCMVSGGSAHTLAIKTDGTLWSWGNNGSGRLGINSTTSYSTPQQEICGGTNWCMVSAGCSHTIAIKTDGTLWSWGENSYEGCAGMLGTNNIIKYSTPTQEHCGGTTWCMVSGGSAHTLAIKTDGTLWSWGTNYYGELGTNNIIIYSTPTQEHCGGTNWCMVSGGSLRTSAIKTDGTLWVWGNNTCGRLGTNNVTNRSTPTQEACGGTNWCNVSAGIGSTSAIKTDGTLWSWGLNGSGRLGTNNITNHSTPIQEHCGFTDWCEISIYTHSSAIRST